MTPQTLDPDGLVAALQRLVTEGGDGNRLVWTRGHAFCVLTGERGGRSLTVEAAPSAMLPEGQGLTLRQVHRLRDAGFVKRPGMRALVRHVALDDPGALRALVDTLRGLFVEVYGASGDDQVAFQLGALDRTENAPLIAAMETLAKKRDHSLRTRVYRELLDAELLLLVDTAGAAGAAAAPPRVVGELSGWDVAGCFTDLAALRHFDPRVPPYRPIRGRQLFPMLAEMPRLGSLLVNPGGRIGGELYRNEVQTLAEACLRRVRTSAP